MAQTLSQFWLSKPREPRESHRPRFASSWPALAELTEGHHRDDEPQAFPDWLLERAERLSEICDHSTEEDAFLIAEHLSDYYATRNFENGNCVVIGCVQLSDGPTSLRCAIHAPFGDGQRPAPYGFDDSTSEDEERPFIEYEDHFSTYTRVSWRRSRTARKTQQYTTQEDTHTNDPQENN
jgi:hypothetical protein